MRLVEAVHHRLDRVGLAVAVPVGQGQHAPARRLRDQQGARRVQRHEARAAHLGREHLDGEARGDFQRRLVLRAGDGRPREQRQQQREDPAHLRPRAVPLVDLLARGEPHALLLAHVVVDRLEVLDPVRDAGDVRDARPSPSPAGSSRPRRRAGRTGPSRAAATRRSAWCWMTIIGMSLSSSVYGTETSGPDCRPDLVGLVVVDPVGDVLDALVGQVVERLPRLGEAGPEPALRLLAGELPQELDGLPDGRALIGQQVHRALDHAVAHELPARVQHGARHRLVGFAPRGR